jgi:hypothetical protein
MYTLTEVPFCSNIVHTLFSFLGAFCYLPPPPPPASPLHSLISEVGHLDIPREGAHAHRYRRVQITQFHI